MKKRKNVLMENHYLYLGILPCEDIYPRIEGKINTTVEALTTIHVFRLTINYLSIYRTAKNNPVPLYSGAIYCYVEGIGDHKRWRDTGKWLCSIPKGQFLDYEQEGGTLIKRTFSYKVGKFKYHLINYYDKHDTNIKPISDHPYIKSLRYSIPKNYFLLNDNKLRIMHVGIAYLYNIKGFDMKNLSFIRGDGNSLDLYSKRIKTLMERFRILDVESSTNELSEREKETIFTLLYDLPFDKQERRKK